MTLEPRLTPARPDLAAEHLRGIVAAARFVPGIVKEVADAQAPVRRQPSPDAVQDTEALRGERVTVYQDNGEGWCWGQIASDGYVGWLPANALRPPGAPATHRIAALRSLEFSGPSIKAPPLVALSLGCRVAVAPSHRDSRAAVDAGGTLARLASGSYVPARHLAAIEAVEPDFVAIALRFVGVPYLWGGKTSLGIDCSGLVQVALTAAGITCPRDSDLQEQGFASLPAVELAALRRGDLVFWSGHVAIACGEHRLVHANAFHMAVAVEPAAEVVSRIRQAGSDIAVIRRLSGAVTRSGSPC
jgi:cell wall-associated NlpC family hydrolase